MRKYSVAAVAILTGGSGDEKAREVKEAFERYCRSTHARHRGQAWREFSGNGRARGRAANNAAR